MNKFRSYVIQRLIERSKDFMTDLSVAYRGLIQLVDTTLYQELLMVPPDTAVPKRKLTLKRLRKAQRVRAAVAAGEEDWTIARTWSVMPVDILVEKLQNMEDLLLEVPTEAPPQEEEDPKAKKGKKGKAEPEPEVPAEKPSMVPSHWVDSVKTESSVYAKVSTAHRALIAGRDQALNQFTTCIDTTLQELRSRYDVVLQQEKSWMQRWQRQVNMLRSGDL